MKKIAIAIVALFTTAAASQAQVNFGVIAGANLSAPAVKSTIDVKSKLAPGFYVGGIVDIGINDMFSVQPGLNLSLKSAKVSTTVFGTEYESKVSPLYIELPVNAVAKFEVGPGKILVNLGPYVAYGVGGKVKSDAVGLTQAQDRSIEWGDDKTKDDLKPLDIGANIGAGYQLANGLFFNVGYQRGFTNLMPGGDSDNKYTTSMIKIGAGFIF